METLRLWTFMPRVAFDKLIARGQLRPDTRRLSKRNKWELSCGRLTGYAWMQEEYRLRVNCAHRGPLFWAYGSKPDLRRNPYRLHKSPGTILLEFDAPRNVVLTSNYYAWESVYMAQGYIPRNIAEDKQEQEIQRLIGEMPDKEVDDLIDLWDVIARATWPRIFDIEQDSRSDLWGKDFILQAVLDHLELRWIRQVTDLDTNRKLGRFCRPSFFLVL